MSEQEVREFEENIVKGANIAFKRLVSKKKKENGELVLSRNGHIFRVTAADLEDFASTLFCIKFNQWLPLRKGDLICLIA